MLSTYFARPLRILVRFIYLKLFSRNKQEIILIGNGDYNVFIIDLLLTLNFLPIGRILNNKICCAASCVRSTNQYPKIYQLLGLTIYRIIFKFIPLITTEEIKNEFNKNKKIVSLSVFNSDLQFNSFSSDNFFLDEIEWLNSSGLGKNIIHAASLTSKLDQKINSWIVTGYPGSGNILVQNICNDLIAQSNNISSHSEAIRNQNINAIRRSYIVSVIAYAMRSLQKHQFSNIGVQRTNYASTHVFMGIKGYGGPQYFNFSNIEVDLEDGLVIGSHEKVTPEAVEHYTKRGIKIINVIRHPLDTVVSCAGKMSRSHDQKTGTPKPFPRLLIDDREWLQNITTSISEYLSSALKHRQDVAIFNYNQYMKERHHYLIQFAKTLNISISLNQAKDIDQKYFSKPLDERKPGHYYKPGNGKWISHFSTSTTQILDELTSEDYLQAFNFSIDSQKLSRKKEQSFLERSDLPQSFSNQISTHECRYHFQTGKGLHSKKFGEMTIASQLPEFICFTSRLETEFTKLISSEIFQSMKSSLQK